MGILKEFERAIKDIRGKDVPESPFHAPVEVNNLFQAIEALVDVELLDFIDAKKERAFELIQEYSKGMATRELFDVFIKALEDAIEE